MAENTDLPTEEEVDKMKVGRLTRCLREQFGMTEAETEEMEKDEARAELKKRIRDIQATAATSRQAGQASGNMTEVLNTHNSKRERLAELCHRIADYLPKLDISIKEQLEIQFGQEPKDILQEVQCHLDKEECCLLVAGETSSGKSSFLNLLLGDKVLPVAFQSSTSTICELKYGETRQAVVHLRELNKQGQRQITIPLDGTEQHQAELKSYMHLKGASRDSLPPAEKIEIFLPLPLLKGGIVIVDSPGVGENKMMDKVVADYIPRAFAFLYIINSASAGGVQPDRLGKLLELYRTKENAEDIDPESAMFICNKWDLVEAGVADAEEQDDLMIETFRKLKEMWPGLKKSQMFYVSTKKAVGLGGILSEDFTKVLDGLDLLLPKSLDIKLETQYRMLQGEHIVEFYGTAYKWEKTEGQPDRLRLGLVMELCEGTLEDRIIGKRDHNPAWWGADPQKQASAFSYTQNLAAQLCEGLKYIHDAAYIHRDLKLINVLVTRDNTVKLADVGLTKREENITGSIAGTPLYTAPEVKERKLYDKSADIYSLGLILWEMWYGVPLYGLEDSAYVNEMEKDLKEGKDIRMPKWDGSVPPISEWTRLIHDCLRKDPGERPKIQQCLDRILALKYSDLHC
ncbi:uncharacterized protein LOC144866430 [Branchiostoma floridae x Branchiostoma japonicum]